MDDFTDAHAETSEKGNAIGVRMAGANESTAKL